MGGGERGGYIYLREEAQAVGDVLGADGVRGADAEPRPVQVDERRVPVRLRRASYIFITRVAVPRGGEAHREEFLLQPPAHAVLLLRQRVPAPARAPAPDRVLQLARPRHDQQHPSDAAHVVGALDGVEPRGVVEEGPVAAGHGREDVVVREQAEQEARAGRAEPVWGPAAGDHGLRAHEVVGDARFVVVAEEPRRDLHHQDGGEGGGGGGVLRVLDQGL